MVLSTRPIKIVHDAFGYADASVLFEQGKTKVLCNVTLQDGVPPFLKNQGTGWLTAEYAMLPCATYNRTTRESNQAQRNARSVEISRLIGRSLRPLVNFKLLGEKTIYVDCDILQADGGTRVASITAASCALHLAQSRWLKKGIIKQPVLADAVAAISVGVVNNEIVLDLNQAQDNQAQADFNFVITKSGALIEVQGTAEKSTVSWGQFDQLKAAALLGIQQIFEHAASFYAWLENKNRTQAAPKNLNDGQAIRHDISSPATGPASSISSSHSEKASFFSLANRKNIKDVLDK